MSDWSIVEILVTVIVAMIAAMPPTIMALLAWRKAKHGVSEIATLRVEVNHRLTELIQASADVGAIRGREDAHREATERREHRDRRRFDHEDDEEGS